MGQWFGVVQLVARGNGAANRGANATQKGCTRRKYCPVENGGSRDFCE